MNRGMGMDEIIKQIAQIDSVAINTKKNSEEALKDKKQQYEKEMADYREETLAKAKERAQELYNEIVNAGETGQKLEEEKSKKLAFAAQNRYLQLEEGLVDEVFAALFGVEG